MNPKEREDSMKTANQPSTYSLILIGVLVTMLGTFMRFAFNSTTLSIISWVVLFVGAIICCKAIFKILDAKKVLNVIFNAKHKFIPVKNTNLLNCKLVFF